MRKCELCDAEATFHVVEVGGGDEGDGTVQRHLCEKCAKRVYGESPRDSGTATRHENETPEEIVAYAKQMAELMRNQINSQSASQLYDLWLRLQDQSQSFDIHSPLYKRLRELHVPFGSLKPIPQSREEWIDYYVQRKNQYWDRLVAFVEKHKRWPTDEEMNDLLGE